MCCAATSALKVISIKAAAASNARIWQSNSGPPASMRVLFAQVSWCNQTLAFSMQVPLRPCSVSNAASRVIVAASEQPMRRRG